MRLITYKEFTGMPSGTIFAPYEPCVLKEVLSIKVDAGELQPNGIYYFNGVMTLEPCIDGDGNLWKHGDQEDASFEVYDGDNNDYIDYDLFLVFEEKDIDEMIDVLKWAKNGCKED